MSSLSGQRYQLWKQIFACFLLLVSLSSYTVLNLSWHWFEETSWGRFGNHLPYLISALGQFLPFIDPELWTAYWEYIEKNDNKLGFFLHLTIPVAFSICLALWVTHWLLWVKGGRENLIHEKGAMLMNGKRAIKHANRMYKQDLKSNELSEPGISIHPKISICTQREQNNVAIFGTTGAGKSMAFKPLVAQAIERGDYALIYDEKGEYTSEFFTLGSTLLLAPWDERSHIWDIYKDVKTKQDAKLIAQCLIPDSSEKEGIWVKGARLLFTGMILTQIRTSKNWGWHELSDMLKTPQIEMQEYLKVHFPIAHSFIQENSKTTQGFYVHLISDLNWIEDLALAWSEGAGEKFSVKDWVNREDHEKRVIIIQADSRFESIGAPLCNAIVSLVTRNYLARDEGAERKTWLFIDEFANLPKNPTIKKWLELARSRGARSVICTQSISQIRQIYGNDDTDAILNLLSNVISLRVGAGGDDARYLSKLFGEQEVLKPNSKNGRSDWGRVRQQVVEEFELTQLKPSSNKGVEGFLFVPSWKSALRLTWPIFKSQTVSNRHVPAKWLLDVANGNEKRVRKNRLNRGLK